MSTDQADDSDPWKDKETLHRLYVEKDLEQGEIAERLGCSPTTLRYWLDKLRVVKPWKDEEKLRELYHDKGLSQQEVADELGCTAGTISEWMERHDIPIKDARGRGDLSSSDTPAAFTHKPEGPNQYEVWVSNNTHLYVHRLLAVAEYGFDALDGMHVHHRNGVPWDNRPDNLALLTPSEHRMTHVNQD